MSPICIAGMHRSGTSMITGVLHAAGLGLGDETRMMPAKPDNPDGFYEHLDFVALNNRLLASFNGAWDCPPDLQQGWHLAEGLSGARLEASKLIQHTFPVGKSGFCGWKDPRNSLTLPFWHALLPDLRVVVCLRNPCGTARSLAARNGHSLQFGLRLWEVYHRSLMASLPAVPHIITHLDSFLVNPEAELARVGKFIGLPVADGDRGAAVARVRTRPRAKLDDDMGQFKRTASAVTACLYDEFRRLAGTVYESLPENRVYPPTLEATAAGITGQASPAATELQAEGVLLRHQLAVALARGEELGRFLAVQFSAKLQAVREMAPLAGEGIEINFRTGGASHLFTLHGWSRADPAGTWSDGNGAAVALPRLATGVRGRATLTVCAAPFLPPGVAAQEVNVSLGGRHVARWQVDRNSKWMETFDASLLAAEGDNLLTFQFSEPWSPRDLGITRDVRRLGLRLSSIAISVAQ